VDAHETPRRGFLGKAAGAAAVSAAFIGGAELAGASPAMAQTTTVPGFFDVTDYGALGNGAHDDTPAIKDAIKAAQANEYGGVVFLPIGQYVVTSPLVVTSGDVLILGAGALATMGGAGYDDGKYTTIKPSAGWAQGSATQPACILFDAITAKKDLSRCGVERLAILGSNLPQGTKMHGIATYGNVGAFSVTGCIIGSIANSDSAGIVNVTGDSKAAQGSSIVRNLVQDVGGDGYDLASGDMTIEHCHAQGCGGNGFSITGSAGDTRIANCRGDLSGANGFYVNVPAGSYLGMVQLSNCSTQRNMLNGIKIANSAKKETAPVYLTGCVFQGDGRLLSSNAGIRLSGPVAATITGCGVHVNTVDISAGVPRYAIVSASDGVAPPEMLSMLGGFYNATEAFADNVNAPVRSDVRVYTYAGHQWGYGKTPTLTTSL
jgi:hypothetical protein